MGVQDDWLVAVVSPRRSVWNYRRNRRGAVVVAAPHLWEGWCLATEPGHRR
jgi:hypothetical protein